MILSSGQRADARRDVLALITAVLDRDAEGVEAIFDAQDGDCWPLASAAVVMLIPVLAAAGHDVRAWVAAVRELDREATRRPRCP